MKQVLTAALALIEDGNGNVIGKMKNIRLSERHQRQEVRGIGTLRPKELPITSWSGTLSCGYYNVDFSKVRNSSEGNTPGAVKRDVSSAQQFEDALTLQQIGLQINIFKKISDAVDANGIPIVNRTPVAIVTNLFMDSEDMDISEGQISGHNQSFMFTDPIIYPPSSQE